MRTAETLKYNLFANDEGNFVEVSDETSESVQFAPQGGGRVNSMPRAAFLDKFKPAELPGFVRVQVEGDWLPEGKSFPALSNGKKWNGWEVPYFTTEVGKELAAHIPNLAFSQMDNAFVATDPEAPSGKKQKHFKAEIIEAHGMLIKAYPIGEGAWCWSLAEKAPVPQKLAA